MHIIGALDTITSGKYLFKGKDISSYTSSELAKFGIKKSDLFSIIQSSSTNHSFKNVERPMLYGHIPSEERKSRVMKALQLVGLERKLKICRIKSPAGDTARCYSKSFNYESRDYSCR